MDDSTENDSARRNHRVPEGDNRFKFLSLVFLILILSLMAMVFLPRLRTVMILPKEIQEPIDHIVVPEEDVVVIPVPWNDPGPVIGPHNDGREKEEDEEKPRPTKPSRDQQKHPEESDEDDLSLLYKGLNPNRAERQSVFYRLSSWIRPIDYLVFLKVGVRGHNGAEESTLEGTAHIKFKVEGDASNLLEIHGEFFKQLNFSSLSFGAGNNFIDKIHQFYNEDKRVYSFLLERPLTDGETYTLVLQYVGSIGHGTLGLYETWYSDGPSLRYSLVTQGEPMSTRKWMPAFDEPAMKAVLHLVVIHPSSLTARSNGAIISSETLKEGNLTMTSFSATPSISPYLYALSVTDYLEKKDTVQGIPISVVLPPTLESHLDSALSLSKQAVNAYLNVLNATRIFQKMDFVFVPDHGSAMENVGHTTFAISYLNEYATYVHEMMHNYFGNLVTLKWWDEVWINEGLTTVYEIDGVHGINTEDSIKNYREIRREAIQDDSLRKAIPLKFDATTEVEARANFVKPYTKGAVVLHMIRNLVGEESWKKGVEKFLRKFEFSSVDGHDFLSTIDEEARGKSSYLVATSFFENRGFPLVRITRKGRTLEVSQERFHRGFINGNKKDNSEQWAIPIHLVKLDGNPYEEFVLNDRRKTVNVDIDETLVLDPKKVLFYRTVYDEETYRQIVKSNLSNATKDEIVDDLMNAAYSGYVEPSLAYSVFSLWESNLIIGEVRSLHTRVSLLFPDRLFDFYRIYTGDNNRSAFDEWKKREDKDTTRDSPFCADVSTIQDAMVKYNLNRTYQSFLCPQIMESIGMDQFKSLIIETSFDLSRPQILHPSDFERLILLFNKKYPSEIANVLLNLTTLIKDEFVLSKLISRARHGLDARSTPQLLKIAEMSPGAARQNAALFTKIFNERHAIETEDRVLSAKLNKEFQQTFDKDNKLKNSKSSKSRVRKPVEIPEEPVRRLRFH